MQKNAATTCVLPAMNFECAGDVEPLTAELTLEWLLTTVVAHVNFEVSLLCELGSADVALEGFDPQVALLVPNKVVLLREGSRALVAGERFFTCVLSCVCLQAGDVRKHLAAHITPVLVHLQKTNMSPLTQVMSGNTRLHTSHLSLFTCK